MKQFPWLGGLALGAALVLVSAAGFAQIERLTLDQMVQRADDAVIGTIVAQKAFQVDHPVDGPNLYFTTVTIQGNSMTDGSESTVAVTFPGGFISENDGAWSSESPRPDEIRVGNRVVAFYAWSDNMGGDVAANALYAAHGGLYQVSESGPKQVVLGRGPGYAVSRNWELSELDSEITRLSKLLKKKQ